MSVLYDRYYKGSKSNRQKKYLSYKVDKKIICTIEIKGKGRGCLYFDFSSNLHIIINNDVFKKLNFEIRRKYFDLKS